MSLTEKKYIKMFCSHLSLPEYREWALKVLHELIKDNDQANNYIKDTIIKSLISSLKDENEPLRITILKFLKDIAESDVGVKK